MVLVASEVIVGNCRRQLRDTGTNAGQSREMQDGLATPVLGGSLDGIETKIKTHRMENF